MTKDCEDWELERVIWKIQWSVGSETYSVVIDHIDKHQAIDHFWGWCPKSQRPTSQNDLIVEPITMVI